MLSGATPIEKRQGPRTTSRCGCGSRKLGILSVPIRTVPTQDTAAEAVGGGPVEADGSRTRKETTPLRVVTS